MSSNEANVTLQPSDKLWSNCANPGLVKSPTVVFNQEV